MLKPSNPYSSHSMLPKGGEIQVLLRTKVETCVPGRRCKEGTIWIEEDPAPITPIRLFVKSYLMNVNSSFQVKDWRMVTYFSFHCAECITSPLSVSMPLILGQEGLFKLPRALIKTSDWSWIIVPVARSLIATFHLATVASHRHSVTSCESRMKRSAEYFLAVLSR